MGFGWTISIVACCLNLCKHRWVQELAPVVDVSYLDGLERVVICDVRWSLNGPVGRVSYEAGHIPGAIFVDLDTDLAAQPTVKAGRHPMPSPQAFAKTLGGLGISEKDPVIAYDDSGGFSAGRLVWMLRTLGHPAALLDGGLNQWDGPLEIGTIQRSPVTYPIRSWPVDAFLEMDEVEAYAKAGVVLDARAEERFLGEAEYVDARPGHIPHAVNAPSTANLGPDHRFLSPDALRDLYSRYGIENATMVVAYCGSGVSACHNLLAMEHAGLAKGRLYAGSWSQWSATDRPAVTRS